jgi:hypothetical protein
MASKFVDFLNGQGIDPRRLVSASRKIERLRPEDRKVRLERRLARADDSSGGDKKNFPKTRSGRPVTERQVQAATAGESLVGPIKNRLLRAVNHVLVQKKKDAVTLHALF